MDYPRVVVVEVNGEIIKFPFGYKFLPTDEELLIHYLKKKLLGEELLVAVITDADVFNTLPWELPKTLDAAVSNDINYFFSIMDEAIIQDIMKKEAVCCGFWKFTGKEKKVISSDGSNVIGIRRKLSFWNRNISGDRETNWRIHELSFGESEQPSYTMQLSNASIAVYRVFEKKNQDTEVSNGEGFDDEDDAAKADEETTGSFGFSESSVITFNN